VGTVTVTVTYQGQTDTFDITVSAEQPPKTLSSIAVKTPPTKTAYTTGETLDLAGLVITASYSDSNTTDFTDWAITNDAGWTTSGFDSSALAENQTVTISYTEDDVTETTTFTVTINEAAFTVGYERGTVILRDTGGNVVTSITLSKSGTTSSATLSVDGAFTGLTWYVDGINKGTGASLILNAGGYEAKNHSVTFTGWRNGSYLSSDPILFTVTN
jgi:hypothetical protein